MLLFLSPQNCDGTWWNSETDHLKPGSDASPSLCNKYSPQRAKRQSSLEMKQRIRPSSVQQSCSEVRISVCFVTWRASTRCLKERVSAKRTPDLHTDPAYIGMTLNYFYQPRWRQRLFLEHITFTQSGNNISGHKNPTRQPKGRMTKLTTLSISSPDPHHRPAQPAALQHFFWSPHCRPWLTGANVHSAQDLLTHCILDGMTQQETAACHCVPEGQPFTPQGHAAHIHLWKKQTLGKRKK